MTLGLGGTSMKNCSISPFLGAEIQSSIQSGCMASALGVWRTQDCLLVEINLLLQALLQ